MKSLKKHLEGKTHVVWDWNGTLLNDVDMVVGAICEVLKEHDRPLISKEEYTAIFRFPVIEYYRALGFDFNKMPFEKISERFVHFYMERILTCQLHLGASELLAEIKAAGIAQSILSAAHEESLLRHLNQYGIRNYFDRVFALSDHHAKGKLERGRELLAAAGHPAEKTILIGDTDHDLEVGKELGIDVILVADGHQSYERLSAIHSVVIENRQQ